MTHHIRSAAIAACAALSLLACGDDKAATSDPAASETTKPTGSASESPSDPAKTTPATPAGSTPGAQAPAVGKRDPGAAPGAPGFSVPEGYCDQKRVSYSVPCHGNADPCNLKSGWPGDEYCIAPPAKDAGIQIHIGPKSYADGEEIAKYVIKPGQEFNNSVLAHIDLADERWYNRVMVSMRPGSHHWISSVVEGKPEERFYDGEMGCGSARRIGGIGGGQNLIYDNPPEGVPAPENKGWGGRVPGDSSLCMNLHAYNYGEQEMLREVWINLYYVDKAEVTLPLQGIGIVGGVGLDLPPGQNKTLTYTGTFGAEGRIVELYGHRHVWTPRFAAWLNDELIYDSWSWQESVTFHYDSITQNPPIATEAKTDGAVSGVLNVAPGDVLKFSCFIENTSDITLKWRNELYGGEMCNMWGSTVGAGSGLNGFFQ